MKLYGAEMPPACAQGMVMIMLQQQQATVSRHRHPRNGSRGYIFRFPATEQEQSGDLLLYCCDTGAGAKRLPVNSELAATFNPQA